ncbi:MAG: hypothetical protein JWM27_2630 [Gemmatimonadetes bacterium]|nr:hypothetical protein [Gemmatimonadota bacterium]
MGFNPWCVRRHLIHTSRVIDVHQGIDINREPRPETAAADDRIKLDRNEKGSRAEQEPFSVHPAHHPRAAVHPHNPDAPSR